MNTIVEACDKIADTATAHDRTFIVEVMGRDCGYLAMTSAIAVGADLALFPEAGKPEPRSSIRSSTPCSTVRGTAARARAARHHHQGRGRADPGRPAQDAGRRAAARAARPMPSRAAIETRVTVLGHVVRGGRPSAFDRLLGSRLANVAVRALIAGQTHKMAAWMPPVELPEEVGDPLAARSVLLARRPRRGARRDRKSAARPEPARALASRRVRRDRGRAPVIVAVPVPTDPSCTGSSTALRSGCTAHRRTAGSCTRIRRSRAMLGYDASTSCSRSTSITDIYVDPSDATRAAREVRAARRHRRRRSRVEDQGRPHPDRADLRPRRRGRARNASFDASVLDVTELERELRAARQRRISSAPRRSSTSSCGRCRRSTGSSIATSGSCAPAARSTSCSATRPTASSAARCTTRSPTTRARRSRSHITSARSPAR